MPAPTAKLGVKWLSPTDIRSTITRIHTNRNAHSNLLGRLNGNVERHKEQVGESLRSLDAKDRPSVVAKAVSGKRLELVRETADQRRAHTRELVELADRVKSAAIHYKSPVQMLMRETLGSERRSRIMQQIANSGPVELASLAEFAAATSDKDLAAALCSRVSNLTRIDRPFSSLELADVLYGELHRELAQAILEAERRVLEALNEDTEFETGKPNPQRSLHIAMLKKREQEVGAYRNDDEDDEAGIADDDAAPIDDTPTGRIEAGLQARRAPASTPANPS
ncbi:hypothetical protein [Sphingorhabdus lacus]|uniref:hypothetical protein n=1 Tax=Sphingorhabdus lacus TaxID=392610 RepID=UPI003592F9E2